MDRNKRKTLGIISLLSFLFIFPSGLLQTNKVQNSNLSSISKRLFRLRNSLFKGIKKRDLKTKFGISNSKIESSLKNYKKNNQAIKSAIKNDFKNKKTCLIDGWVLSHTEVILCLMI